MERIYIDNNSKLHKLMALSGAISPINNSPVSLYIHPRRTSGFDSRANRDVLTSLENLDSPIVRYYRSGMPLSAIENLEISPPQLKSTTVFKTPVKVEEDVLVMDGILVRPVTGGRVRSLSLTSDSGGSSSSGGKSFYKTEICRSWEDFGSCRYGAKCQFAHGKEELRPTRFSNKSKLEICKSYSSGSCSYGSKCRFIHQQNNSPASGTNSPFTVTSSPQTVSQNNSPASTTDSLARVIPSIARTVSPINLENAINCAGSSSSATQIVSPIKLENAIKSFQSHGITFASTDWSPLDDGIEVALPCSSSTDKALSREEVDAYINSVIYGSNKKKTLPVFAAICPR